MNGYFEECININPRYSVIYQKYIRDINDFRQPKSNKRVGEISYKSQNRIKKYIDWLISLSIDKKVIDTTTNKSFKFKLSFITLTLPAQQIHPDKVILKQCLEPFIRKLRDKHGMKYYLWKAETQLNGNIHFHITTNIFIHYRQARLYWNTRLKKLGYLSRCRFNDPPTTEVKAVRKSKDIAAYLSKYIAKNENSRTKPLCKLWDCNNELKQMNFNISGINSDLSWDPVIKDHLNQSKLLQRDYCALYLFDTRLEFRHDDISICCKELLNEKISLSGQKSIYHTKNLFKISNKTP